MSIPAGIEQPIPGEFDAAAIAAGMKIPADVPMTGEQLEEFRKRWEEAAAQGFRHVRRWTPEEIRSFLAENVTVVAPGETLIIRAYSDWTPSQCIDYQRYVNEQFDGGFLPFRVLLVHGAELGVVKADGDG